MDEVVITDYTSTASSLHVDERKRGGMRETAAPYGFTPQCEARVLDLSNGSSLVRRCVWEPGHPGLHRYEHRVVIEWGET